MTDEDRLRRRNAKLSNERLKLIAAFCNTIGVATFVTLVLAPVANQRLLSLGQIFIAILAAGVLHGAGHYALRFWRSED